MNLGEAKARAIKLINEYSNNGSLISAAQNADYLNRMNDLAHDAQMEICEQFGIAAKVSYTLTKGVERGYNKLALPTGYKTSRFVNLNDKSFSNYRIENGYLLVSKRYEGNLELSYVKYPSVIDSTSLDNYVFEIDLNAQTALPYYLAGMVIADENSEISAKLLGIYYSRVSNTVQNKDKPPSTVRNSMGW